MSRAQGRGTPRGAGASTWDCCDSGLVRYSGGSSAVEAFPSAFLQVTGGWGWRAPAPSPPSPPGFRLGLPSHTHMTTTPSQKGWTHKAAVLSPGLGPPAGHLASATAPSQKQGSNTLWARLRLSAAEGGHHGPEGSASPPALGPTGSMGLWPSRAAGVPPGDRAVRGSRPSETSASRKTRAGKRLGWGAPG